MSQTSCRQINLLINSLTDLVTNYQTLTSTGYQAEYSNFDSEAGNLA